MASSPASSRAPSRAKRSGPSSTRRPAVPDRRILQSTLAGATLTDQGGAPLDYQPVAMMPDVKVLKVGGQSIMDRGRTALFPILDEIVAAKDTYKLLLCCGGGTRARHIYD